MGDIAQILAPTAATVPSIAASSDKAVKMAGMSKEAMYFMKGNQDPSSASLPPVVPTFSKIGDKETTQDGEVKVKVRGKWISSSKRARPWTWAPFASSSRSDGAMFHHWVRKNVEYTDYPYAKFDVHMDPVIYSAEEYEMHLQSETWTKSETDRLMELARIFECRWPVIFDRFCLENSSNHSSDQKTESTATGMIPSRKIEDLQHRYYGVAAILAQLRIAQEAASEARALSVAAAKSAATTTATATPTPATTSSSVVAGAAPGPASAMAKQQERTDNLLMESAAARSLATTAKQHQPLMNHVGTGTSNKMFDLDKEKERRHHLDRLWRRSKEEEEEEIELRKELKTIEAQLRKLKKHGGHVLAAAPGRGKPIATTPRGAGASNAQGQLANAPTSRGTSRSATPIPTSSSVAQGDANDGGDNSNVNSDIVDNPDTLDEYFSSTAPVPMSQYPYLQSGRLVPPASGGSSGINKSLLTRMNEVLSEFNIPERPIPTKRVCDMYDLVRKDVLTLLTLKKMLMQREGQLQSKRLRLSRMGGAMLPVEDKVLDEERLLGISPPPKPTSSAATGSSPAKAKTTKRKSPSAATAKSKATTAKKPATDAKPAAATTTGKKKTVKRKRKSEPGKTPTAASSSASTKAPAPGSAAAKAAKARATAAAPKTATTPANAVSSATTGAAIPSAGAPKPAAEAATTPRTKASTAATTAKTATGSAAKRSRKS